MRGYIFPCSNETMAECLIKNLFGTTIDQFNKFKNLKDDDYIFLYNYSEQYLYGIWKALTSIGTYDPNAWNGRFHCQVKVKLFTKEYIRIPKAKIIQTTGIDPSKNLVLNDIQLHKLLDYFSSNFSNTKKNIENLIDKIDDYRTLYPPNIICIDGHRVRSKAEKIIDDWLFQNNVKHIYEPIITQIPERLIPDWFVENPYNKKSCYIEFWGLEDFKQYKKTMERKLKIYIKYNLPLIEIRDEHIKNIDYYLSKMLRKFEII